MKLALLVIDAQKVYTDPSSELCCKSAAGTVKNINALIERFQRNRLPIFLVRHVHKADGSDLGRMFDYTGEAEDGFNFKEGSAEVEYDANLRRPPNTFEIVKNRYSAFSGTVLHERLKQAGVSGVAICGFMTNFCCESTARDAHDLDYFVDFVIDATGTPGTDKLDQRKIRSIVAELLGAGFARVATTKTFLKTA